MTSRTSIRRISSKRLAQRGGKVFSTIQKRTKPRRKRPDLFYQAEVPAIFVDSEGREICNMDTKQGRDIYKDRILAMLRRQGRVCCNCKKPLWFNEATFEHENGRGAGKQDDRITANGKRINGASHAICNQKRGSKRTPIWHGEPKISSMEE